MCDVMLLGCHECVTRSLVSTERPGHNWTITIFWYHTSSLYSPALAESASLSPGSQPGRCPSLCCGSRFPLVRPGPDRPSTGITPGPEIWWEEESAGARYKVYIKSQLSQSQPCIIQGACCQPGPMRGQNLRMLDQFYRICIRPQQLGSFNKMMPSSPTSTPIKKNMILHW